MRRVKIAFFTCFFCVTSFVIHAQQWSSGTAGSFSTIYTTTLTNRVGIGTNSPSIGKLQIGAPGNGDTNKIVIPGIYNFEKIKLGQYPNGAGGLEFINHNNAANSYGVRLLANLDQGGAGLQLQYAPAVSAEGSLSYSTGMFMRAVDGNIGIGTTSPATKLQIAEGAEELGKYGTVQIVKPATPPAGNVLYLSFIKQSTMFTGFGYANNSNNFCFWYGQMTDNTSPLMSYSGDYGQSVGIGTLDTKGYKLAVAGSMVAEKVVVKTKANWPDYVFDSTYNLKPLSQVENYIKLNKHLPEIQPAADIEKNGIDLGNNQAKLLQKIEELTLYLIEQKKEITLLKKAIETLQKK